MSRYQMPGSARERMANPPAGTAPAPPFRHAFRKGVLNERGGGYVTEMGTDVKERVAVVVTSGLARDHLCNSDYPAEGTIAVIEIAQ